MFFILKIKFENDFNKRFWENYLNYFWGKGYGENTIIHWGDTSFFWIDCKDVDICLLRSQHFGTTQNYSHFRLNFASIAQFETCRVNVGNRDTAEIKTFFLTRKNRMCSELKKRNSGFARDSLSMNFIHLLLLYIIYFLFILIRNFYFSLFD